MLSCRNQGAALRLWPCIAWSVRAATCHIRWPSAHATDVVWPSHGCWESLTTGNNTPLQPMLRQLLASFVAINVFIKKSIHGTPCPALFGGFCLGLFGIVIFVVRLEAKHRRINSTRGVAWLWHGGIWPEATLGSWVRPPAAFSCNGSKIVKFGSKTWKNQLRSRRGGALGTGADASG